MGSSSNRLASLTFWIVAASVAIAVLGSSTLLFPGPDVGGPATAPPGRDIVARVVAPFFAPPPVREQPPPPPPVEPQPVAAGTAPSTGVAAPPATPTAEPTAEPKAGQFADGRIAEKPGVGAVPKSERKSKGPRLARAGDTGGRGRGHGLALGKGHGRGPISFEAVRGAKQPHVRHAKTHGKSGRRAPAHARARR